MSFPQKTILLADHSKVFLSHISILLDRMGFKVISVADGIEAIKAVNDFSPDLAMLEMTLPKIDGLKALRQLKNSRSTFHTPVVIMSIDSRQDLIDQCIRYGCAGFLQKPVMLDSLHEILQDCIFAPTGVRRRHVRASYITEVTITQGRRKLNTRSDNLSSGGIFVRSDKLFNPGDNVKIKLPVPESSHFVLSGTVVYISGPSSKISRMPSGMAIEFKDLSDEMMRSLDALVTDLLIGDILECQTEGIISS